MKKSKILSLFGLTILMTTIFVSCNTDSAVEEEINQEFQEVELQLQSAGFDTSDLYVGEMEGVSGYVIEGDIFLTVEEIQELAPRINAASDSETFADGDIVRTEHWRTRELVRRRPRTINVFLDPAFNSNVRRAFNNALRRYNRLNLELTFRSVNSRAAGNIDFLLADLPRGVLGRSGGFPRNGNPAPTITLARAFFGPGAAPREDAATTIAHEIGHAIGFRHTDLFDRSFSCGGLPVNEGRSGARHVPGTPRGPEANSYMLACSNGTNRPFTRGDRRALRRIY